MRIAMLSWETLHSISVGGVGVHVTELAAALERKGHEVHVFTRMAAGQGHLDRVDGVWYHRCPFELRPNFIEEINAMCRSFVHHLREVEDHMNAPFDVVHAHDWLTANAMIWLKQDHSQKTIFTIHSTEYGRCGNVFFDGQSEQVRAQERAATYWADRVVAVSGALKNEVAWMYEVPDWKIDVVYNAVNVGNFDGWLDPGEVKRRYGTGPIDPLVLFAGRLVEQKGPDILVEAIPMVLHHYPQAKFVFVGDGELRLACERRGHELGIMHATRFVGHKSGGELQSIFKACDAVCVPSRNEPFGIVVLEAWSAGKPVVATVNGGPNEFVWHEVNGLKVFPHPESVAWGLGTLFTNWEWARWMGENGRRAAEQAFNWDTIGDQMLQAYHA